MVEDKLIKKTNWKPTDHRFVGFFDILGFKDLVMRSSHSEIYIKLGSISKIKKELEDIAKMDGGFDEYGDADIYIVNFSDSIVIFSKNDNYDNFKFFIRVIRWLQAKTIESSIPLKGGFAHGEISVNQSEQIYFGQSIIDAYLIEEDVNYFGIVAHNSIDRYISMNSNLISPELLKKLFFEIKTPLKSGSITHLNVNWFSKTWPPFQYEKEDEIMPKIISIIEKFKLNTSGSPRRYVDNTISVLNSLGIDLILNANKH